MSENFHEQAKVALMKLQAELAAITDEIELLVERRKKVQAQYMGLRTFITATDSVESRVDESGGTSRIVSAPSAAVITGAQTPQVRQSRWLSSDVNAQGDLIRHWRSSAPGSASIEGDMRSEDTSWISGTQRTSLKDSVLSIVEKFLADGKPHPTKELVEEIQAHGVAISGADPVITVSSILSREKDKFLADRKHGWTLK
ncbi:hypothetical protein [Janthinobacterium sp. SUN120]|uniref:hypothetical protein n=1 Tax=Janthinobacterium sp. SUN120 TaxID=3004099 RepID=UPI0025B1E9DA|nr:hypothetical protein [Janthinobacterium sp. SUN120]MDN2713789.1 hypothetical protein [Janthinobacterium sp. SUN120]